MSIAGQHEIMSKIDLRPTTQSDIEFVVSAERVPGNAQFILPWERAQHVAALTDPDLSHLCIWLGHRKVGFVLLAGLTSVHHSIEFRRIVVTEQGLGIGRRAIQFVKQVTFSNLNTHRLWLDVKEGNRRARGLYTSEGFVTEGTLRECLLGSHGFESLVVMSILAGEFTASRLGAAAGGQPASRVVRS
jgi:diamine N-acetyltransferase